MLLGFAGGRRAGTLMHQSRECAAAGTAIKMLILGGSQTLNIYYKVFLVAMLKGSENF